MSRVPEHIVLRFRRSDIPLSDLRYFLHGVERDWVGCRIMLRYSYWELGKWSMWCKIDRRITDKIFRDERVEEFALYLRSPLYVISPN